MRQIVVCFIVAGCTVGVPEPGKLKEAQIPSPRNEETTAWLLFSLDGSDAAMREAIGSLEHADPIKDAEAAHNAGDRRLLALYGYALEIPGLSNGRREEARRYKVVPVEGTSDFIRSESQARFQELLRKYAQEYNSSVLNRGVHKTR